MRLPGFVHRKGEPFVTRIVSTSEAAPYKAADFQKADVFDFMDRLKVIVRATSLGDVHSTVLYPAISSHRDISPRQRERMGILDSTVRLCIGIENIDDIIQDLEQALATP